jgi:EAL domain-containing protein (putative c-di-GMP-specific phosphodiesterase class I)
MPQLGGLILQKVCHQMSLWNDRGLEIPVMSVNVSAEEFYRQGFVDRFTGILNQYQIATRQIQVEITETSIMRDHSLAMIELERLASYGLRISIDDFGTGYSSLSYLKKLPVREIKIDRSFVMNLHQDHGNLTIVKAILAIAREMDLTVIAEGIELETELDTLISLNCAYGQGFLLGRPMKAHDFEQTHLIKSTPQPVE